MPVAPVFGIYSDVMVWLIYLIWACFDIFSWNNWIFELHFITKTFKKLYLY